MRGEEKRRHHHYRHHHRLLSFRLHVPHLGHGQGHGKRTMVPAKGWIGIRVGQEGEEKQRFEVPVEYLKHPLFVGLLEQTKKEYGFEQKGPINIPCGIDHFRHVRSIIDRDTAAAAARHLPRFVGCFRA
ncbi:auxin-responsive protein SAUR32-like [Elaeis guineensis]|uniref:auxin-responsive protein SAUR32-like n=1 Tax=Elaeis guineensis var. tenera TaxID=51953 RepID=UPI003C6D17E5